MATSTTEKNIVFLRQQFSAAISNSSVVVKFVCVAVTVGYFFSFSNTLLNFLTVVPGHVTPPNFYFWTYFTHSFIEVHIWNVVVDIGVVILYGKLLEPLWGAMEMLIFYTVVNIGVALCTSLIYITVYLITKNEVYLFQTHIHGLAGYLAGFSVAVKQVMPDHVLVNSAFGKLRNKHIPHILLYLAIIVRIIGGVDGPYPIMFGMGIVVSWIYLRFYQKHPNGNRGDMADSFTFASFFPDAMAPFVGVVSNTIFDILVRVKICKKHARTYPLESPKPIIVSLPGSDPQEAERRKKLALLALNQRMASVEPALHWPSMDDEKDGATSSASSTTTPATTPIPSETKQMESKHSRESSSGSAPKLPVPDFKENQKAMGHSNASIS